MPLSRKTGPRGLSRAHAQKLIAKPVVANASISQGDLVVTRLSGCEVTGVVTVVPMAGVARLR